MLAGPLALLLIGSAQADDKDGKTAESEAPTMGEAAASPLAGAAEKGRLQQAPPHGVARAVDRYSSRRRRASSNMSNTAPAASIAVPGWKGRISPPSVRTPSGKMRIE